MSVTYSHGVEVCYSTLNSPCLWSVELPLLAEMRQSREINLYCTR